MQEIDHTANPFPGLRPFESNETHLFFGRDGQSEELLRRLKRTRFLAVVGTSGSGKSSLVRAGLLPALQGGLMASAGSDWRIAILRPGSDPIGNLARALASSEVLGSRDQKDANNIQAVLAETTLRRSGLGLVELVRRARTKIDQQGQPQFRDYENLLVVVDQFEELFRFKQLIEQENSGEDAAAFVKLLLEAVGRNADKIYVVLTMRSDFLGDCSQFWGLPEAINDGQYLIPRMTRDERREAISGPVAVGNGAISEPLINQLLNDVGDNPDQLPILQHALMRTWDYWTDHRRNGDPIDIPDYNAIGSMTEALSRHADEAYAELNDSQKIIAEKMFKGLTEKGADNREIRRPIEVQEICGLTGADEAAVISVVEVFRHEKKSFLVPPPIDALTGARVPLTRESLIDISHESLIRNWARLRTWVDDESHSARIYKRLAETAVLHRAGEEALLMDPALQVALDWREKNRPNAVWARRYHPEFETAMSFLDQSVAARDAETREREKRRRREATYKRSRWVLVVLGLAFTLSLAALTYSYSSLKRANLSLAEANQKFAMAQQQLALATRAEAEAIKLKDFAQMRAVEASNESELAKEDTHKAKAAHAAAVKQKQKAQQAEVLAVQQMKIAIDEQNEAKRAQQESLHLLYAADINLAQQAYESSNTKRVEELLEQALKSRGNMRGFEWNYLRHLLDNEKSSLPRPGDGLLVSVTSPDGKLLAVAAKGKVKIRDIGSTEERYIDLSKDFGVGSLAFSPDGTKLAVGSSNSDPPSTIEIYDTKTRERLRSFRDNATAANTVVFASDSKHLIVGGGTPGSVEIWDVDSPRKVDTLPANGTVFLDISRDGKMLAAGSMNDETKTFPVLLWDMSARDKVNHELLGHGGQVTSIAFSQDGNMLASGSLDRTVRIWDPKTGYSLEVLSFATRVFSVAFSPRGRFLAIGLEDGSIKMYDVRDHLDGPTLIGHHLPVTFLSFGAGRLLFSSDNKLLSGPDDEALLFEESSQTIVKQWDVATLTREQTPYRLAKDKSFAGNLVYSPDGKTLVAHTRQDLYDEAAFKQTFINMETNRPIETPNQKQYYSVAFSPDGKLMATDELSRRDRRVVVVRNASNQQPIGEPIDEDGELHFQFSPNGKLLATCTMKGLVKIRDATSLKVVSAWETNAENLVRSMSFSGDNKLIIMPDDRTLEVWNLNSQKLVDKVQFSEKFKDARVINFSPDGRYVAASYEDGTTDLYDSAGKLLATFKCQSELAPTLAFSSSGRLLATGGFDGKVKIWDTVSRRELLTLKGTPYKVLSIAFSDDETKLAILDAYSYLRVWRAPLDLSASASRPIVYAKAIH